MSGSLGVLGQGIGGRVGAARAVAPSILVIDDDPFIREVMAEALVDEGYAVETAGDGAEALRALERRRYGLVLLDMHMPVLDGWSFAAELRARGHRVPIVVMTAGADAAACAAEIGAVDFMPKPFRLTELLALVAALVAG